MQESVPYTEQLRTFTGRNRITLSYYWNEPSACTEGKRYPIVLYWHGVGGETELSGYRYLRDRLYENTEECFLLAPLAVREQGQWWVDYEKVLAADHEHDAVYRLEDAPVTPSFLTVCELLADMCRRYPIDPSRVYVMGVSMGGYASWEMLCRLPQSVSAAVPICGGCDPTKAPRIADIPVWTFHGDRDEAVAVNATRAMVEALRQAGSKVVRYTEYPGLDHGIWLKVFDESDMWHWLFAQRRKTVMGADGPRGEEAVL